VTTQKATAEYDFDMGGLLTVIMFRVSAVVMAVCAVVVWILAAAL